MNLQDLLLLLQQLQALALFDLAADGLLVREIAALLLVELFARHRVDQRREPAAPQELTAPVHACIKWVSL